MTNQQMRLQLEMLAEQIINLLDLLDGDSDWEDDGCTEEDSDQDNAPIMLDSERKLPRIVA